MKKLFQTIFGLSDVKLHLLHDINVQSAILYMQVMCLQLIQLRWAKQSMQQATES